MGRPECDGTIASLVGHDVALTGKTCVDGLRVIRGDLLAMLMRRGASEVAADRRKRTVSLLVVGELGDNVVDWRLGRSQKLVYYENQRRSGNHVCIVDDAGISALLRGHPAPCLESRLTKGKLVEFRSPQVRPVVPAPEPDPEPIVREPQRESPRLTPVTVSANPVHDVPVALSADLTGLDEATARHTDTLRQLIDHLAPRPVFGLTRPKLDAAWADPDDPRCLLVGEVKSLTDTNQDQQIRLGIGQVLDYTHQVRQHPPDAT